MTRSLDERIYDRLVGEAWRPDDQVEEVPDHVAQFRAMLDHELGWCRTALFSAECAEPSIIRWALSIGAEYESNAVVRGVGYLRFTYSDKRVTLAVTEESVQAARRVS